jgi:butyrate kinase
MHPITVELDFVQPLVALRRRVDTLVLTGGIASDGKTVAIATAKPVPQTITFADSSILYGLCEQAGTLVKM